MRNKLLLFLFLINLFSCKRENLDDCITSTGDIIDEQRILASFEHIELYDNMEVTYTQANFDGVTITAGENLLESIKTEVNNGVLVVENRNKCNWVRSFEKKISLEIFSKDLSSITYFAHGQFNFSKQLISDTLLLNVWESSGDLQLNVNANYVELKSHTGTGTITCMGEANELVAFMGGNGFVDANSCSANKVLAVNENTGKLYVNCLRNLKVDISGSGDIFYTGNPDIELINIGPGELINAN